LITRLIHNKSTYPSVDFFVCQNVLFSLILFWEYGERKQKIMYEDIETILNQIRPSLEADGGGIDLVNVDKEQGIIRVKLQGACRGCPMAIMTLKMGVEAVLCEQFPWVREVVAVDEEENLA